MVGILVGFFLSCSDLHFKYDNASDIKTPTGLLMYLYAPTFFANWGGGGSQPRLIFSYADRIIIASESYSSTAPSVWVSTDGITFTKSSVKLGDCTGSYSSSSSGNIGCIVSAVGYENGTYAVFGYKTQNSTGSSSTLANYFGKGTDLSTITVNSTSPGATIGSNQPFIYSSGKFHAYQSGTTNAIYTTSDGSSWTPYTASFSCSTMYLADSGTPACGLSKYYNGTTWINAGAISGGGGVVNTSSNSSYLDNAFYAWQNNSGTLTLYKSTSGSITSGVTFPGAADSSISLSSSNMRPEKIVKTSGGVYLMYASNWSNNVNTLTWLKSTNGTSWSIITPTFPNELGTVDGIYGLGALGNTFFASVSFKVSASSSNTNSYLMKSTDGQTWTKVSL